MTIPHDPWLVALSIAIAIQGSFVGLSLARGIDSAEGFRRRVAIAGSAITLATGVWSMHFVAMLAANFPSAVDYLVLPTLISFLICVIVVGVGAYAAHMSGPPAFRIGTGALAMGLGVSLMHYVGMSAVHLAGPTSYAPAFVVASIAVAIAASAFALWTIDSRPTRPRLFLGAIALGLAISGMHYTAMAGMRLDPLCYDVSRFVGAESALSRNTLALLATIVSFGVSGAFLLSLVPDGRAPRGAEAAPAAAEPASPLVSISAHALESAPLLSPSAELEPVAPAGGGAVSIRVEKDGRARDIAVSDIYAIRANAHYTYVHDGDKEYFCNLSISALEAQLDPKAFLRVHRSDIVAVDRIARVKRSGEAGVAELGAPVRCSIPIARA
ncbi:MAG: LytTR family transcriptional regulator DNA-binding domain-containing protein, partial [Hyphomicrobiales bacterium]|nr:LytTR family transcriptional regulator DNA-binding domain-containing protein [Hyphomicrobiales bacterium]